MNKTTVYECEYCGYYKKNKKTVDKHEAICFYNPDTKSCATCIYYSSIFKERDPGSLEIGFKKMTEKCEGGIEMNGKLKTQCPAHVWDEKYYEALEILSEKENKQYSHAEILEAMNKIIKS